MFKIFNGLESILPADFSDTDKTRYTTTGQPFKITKMHSRLDLRKYSFTQRILNDWNQLPETAVMSKDNYTFKGHNDKYLKNKVEDYTSQRLTLFLVISSSLSRSTDVLW